MISNRPTVLFAYRYGVLGGVSTQLLNRVAWAGSVMSMHVLFERDYGMVQAFPEDIASHTEDHDEKVRRIRQIDPDVMVVIDSPSFLRAWQEAGSPGRLVIEVHTTTDNFEYLNRLEPDLPVEALVTVSQYMANRVRETRAGRSRKVFVVPNCLDEGWFADVDALPIEGRPLLWVGKLDDHKRFTSALDLLDACVRTGSSDLWPLLVGGYTAREDRVAYLLSTMSSQPGLRRGRWWPWVGHHRMPSLYRTVAGAGGLLVLTTRDESFGMTVAEGISMGCPVVAPAVGAIPELLPPEAMYEPGSMDEAQALVHRVLTDHDFAHGILEAAAATVATSVDPIRSREAYRQLLDWLLVTA